MKKIIIAITLCLFVASSINAQKSVVGKWKTIDDATGEARSVIEIYEKNQKYYGKIVEILSKEADAQNCTTCEGKYKGKPMIGVEIITGLQKNGTDYEDGTIIDPENAKTYNCKIWLEEDNHDLLNVRGYVLFLYRTQQWQRVD